MMVLCWVSALSYPNLLGRLKGFVVVFLPLLVKIANISILKIGVNALACLHNMHEYPSYILERPTRCCGNRR